VPLTAQHAGAGVLDATADPLGEDVRWEAVPARAFDLTRVRRALTVLAGTFVTRAEAGWGCVLALSGVG
jgi:hypothetical protein